MQWINAYFKGVTVLKWLIFTFVALLIVLALEWQIERVYWQLKPFTPIKIHSIKIFNPDSRVYRPGDTIPYLMDVEKLTDDLGVVTRQWVSDEKGFLPAAVPMYPPAKELKRQKVVGYMYMPKAAEDTKYQLVWSVNYRRLHDGKPFRITLKSDAVSVYSPKIPVQIGPKGDVGKAGPIGQKGQVGERGERGGVGKNFWGERK